MHISNDPAGGAWSGPFADLLRLQTEFQSRLGEETIRYLRRLQGALGPAAPGTVVLAEPGHEIVTHARNGDSAELAFQLENLQRVHCVVSPQLTPLVSESGTTWFPAAEGGSGFRILAPGAADSLVLRVAVPAELPAGTYRGAVMLVGFRDGAIPVSITVDGPEAEKGEKTDAVASTAPDTAPAAKATAARRRPPGATDPEPAPRAKRRTTTSRRRSK